MKGDNIYGYQFEKVEQDGNANLFHMVNDTGHGYLTHRNILQGLDFTYDHIYMQSFWKNVEEDTERIIKINHCLKGQFAFRMKNGKDYCMKRGQVCISNTGCGSVASSVVPGGCYQGFSIRLNLEEIKGLIDKCNMTDDMDFSPINEIIYRQDGPILMEDLSLLKPIIKDFYLLENCNNKSLYLLKITELLLNLCIIFKQKNTDLNKYSYDTINTVRQIHDRILSEPFRKVTVQELSEEFFLSRTGLSQCFKEMYGSSPAAFMRSIKMKHAANKIIKYPEMSIRELASLSGYENQSKFAAAFKAEWGLSPLEFKKKKLLEIIKIKPRDEDLD